LIKLEWFETMSKHSGQLTLLIIQRNFDRSAAGSLHAHLYQVVRRLVFEGELPGGTQLPSSRLLAEALGLSRHTVSTAVEGLVAEGYLTGRPGSGTYVSSQFSRGREADGLVSDSAPLTSSRGLTMIASPRSPFTWKSGGDGPPLAFRMGLPAVDVFPTRAWQTALTLAWQDVSAGRLGYQEPNGLMALREWVTSYLGASRGLACRPEQVVIVGGSQGALDLCFRVLLDPGDVVAMEDPGYLGARAASRAAGAGIAAIPVDGDGLDVGQLRRVLPRPRAVYVTPTHQFPLGVTMSLSRRLALTRWAASAGAWIVEDDYDSEHRYGGRPFDPLAVLDHTGRTIYIGTFSKVMFPSLRLGYLVLPPGLIDVFEAAQLSAEVHRPVLEQQALVRFMEAGHFSRHLRRTKELYAERRDTLLTEARSRLSGLLDVHPAQAGLHLFGSLPRDADDIALAELAARGGVDVWPLSIHAVKDDRKGFLLGYGGTPAEEIPAGIERLARTLTAKSVGLWAADAGVVEAVFPHQGRVQDIAAVV
jgi:GntR family transcriptional regulator/MocR family aminotransferase